MPQWEYSKIDLNNVPAKTSELDSLDDAGKDGWELVRITANNLRYLKRPVEDAAAAAPPRAKEPVSAQGRHDLTVELIGRMPAQACSSLASSARSVGARSSRARA